MEPKFTKGPVSVEYDNSDCSAGGKWFNVGPAKVHESYNCGPEREAVWRANANLIAAAFNAATEMEELGYDGQKAIEALPEFAKTLVSVRADYVRHLRREAEIAFPYRDDVPDNWEKNSRTLPVIDALLAKARGET